MTSQNVDKQNVKKENLKRMFSLNRATIVGNLTRDPETRAIPSGQTVCSFAVATNRRWKDKDGNTKEDTQFHEVTAWGKLGELAAQMLSKGKKVYVEGRLQTNSWEGTDGAKRSRTEIVAENFIPLSPKGDVTPGDFTSPATDEVPKGKKTEKTDAVEEINLDDIPF
ncbi:MAG: single-stranded DNA-binding protein [Candidatus Berkelbacteria bacterium]|nr:single-stranded DNA-binding protein [Candidatus Berkelbacteria bacterium]